MLKFYKSNQSSLLLGPKCTNATWTRESLQKIFSKVNGKTNEGIPWHEISNELNRSVESCRSAYYKHLKLRFFTRLDLLAFKEKETNNHGKFTGDFWLPSELLTLYDYTKERGPRSPWKKISEKLKKSPDKCQRAYQTYLHNPDVNSSSLLSNSINASSLSFYMDREWPDILLEFEKKNNWTVNETSTLMKMGNDCKDWTAISKAIGRSPEACRVKFFREVDKPKRVIKRWTEDELKYLSDLGSKPHPEWEIIAQRLDRSVDSCFVKWQRIRREKGIRSKTVKWTPSMIQRLEGLVIEGETVKKIAKTMGRSESSINYALKEYDIHASSILQKF